MNIKVDYLKKQFGIGDTVREYSVELSEVTGLYVGNATSYDSREVEIRFRSASSSPGLSWDETSDAKVLGGTLELSHDAARTLANAILQFLDGRDQPESADSMIIQISERPEHRRE